MFIRNQLKMQTEGDPTILNRSSKKNVTISSLDKHKAQFNEINDNIVTEKKFTDAALSLESLADDFNISVSFLSQLINTYSDSNFTDYINKYRVEQVKELLMDKNYTNYTILSIGLESGFNSKSTFYTAFKKHANCTPAEYKQGVMQQKLVRNHNI